MELANAMVLAGLTDQTVELPMDGAAFEALLRKLIAESKKDIAEIVPVSHPLVADLLTVPAEAAATSEGN